MKKIFIVLLILCVSFNCYANPAMMRARAGIINQSSGADYSDITFYHDCEALDDANKAGGSATMTYGGGISVGTGIVGSGSLKDADGADKFSFVIANNLNLTSGRIGFYWKPTGNSADETGYYFYSLGGDGREAGLYGNNTNDRTYMFYDNQEAYIENTGLSAGTWYFIETKYDSGTATWYLDGVEKDDLTDSSLSLTDTTLYFMDRAGYSHMGGEFDQIICSNDPDRDLNAIKTVTDFS